MVKALFWLALAGAIAFGVVWVKFPHLLYRFEKPHWKHFTDPAGTYELDMPGMTFCGLEPDVTVGETCRNTLWNWDLRVTRLGFVSGGKVSGALGKVGLGAPSMANAERELRAIMDIESQAPVAIAGDGNGQEFRGKLKKGYAMVRAAILKESVVLFTIVVRDAKDAAQFDAEMKKHADVVDRFFSSARAH